jgi:hypothetical protein
MSGNLPISKKRKLALIIPADLFTEFSIAVLREYGPRQKANVMLHLMREFVERSRERQGQAGVLPATSPQLQEGDKPR